MIKIVIGTVLIILACGGWVALDYLNTQERMRAMELHKGIEQARLEAKKRIRTKENFESMVHDNQSSCEAAAEKAQSDYTALMLKVMPPPRKKNQPVVIPQATLEASAAQLASAKELCRQLSSAQLKNGF